MIRGTGTLSPTIRVWASLTDDPLLTVAELSARLGAHESTVRRWIHSGKLKAHKIGGKLRVRTSTALRFAGEVTNE
jgi:excisionase family DNA binding protein